MLTGRLYDGKTLNEIGNRPRRRLPLWWEEPAAEQAGNRVRHTRNGGTATLRDDEVWLSPFPRSYGSSTWLITCTMPFDAEVSTVAMPAAESCSRVSFEPFSIT